MTKSYSPVDYYPSSQEQVIGNIELIGQTPEAGITFSPEQSFGCMMYVLGDPVTGRHNKRHVLDMAGHVASMLLGYNHPALMSEDVSNELALAARCRFASGDFGTPFRGMLGPVFQRTVMRNYYTHSIFFTEGARAVECACKIGFYCRQDDVSLNLEKEGRWLTPQTGFHGRSVLALSLTKSYDLRKHHNMPVMDCVERVACPTIGERENPEDLRAREDEALYDIDQKMKALGERFIGFVMEPMLGEGGYQFYSARFLQELESLIRKYRGIFIIDEIQTAFACGRVFLHEAYDVTPDLVVFGKKFGMSGVLSTEQFTQNYPWHPLAKPESRVSSTWSGDPVADVRLRAMLEFLETSKVMQLSIGLGSLLRDGLERIRNSEVGRSMLSHVRGDGLLAAVDVSDAQTRSKLINACLENDLLVVGCGFRSIRFCPPITITQKEIALCLERFERAVRSLAA